MLATLSFDKHRQKSSECTLINRDEQVKNRVHLRLLCAIRVEIHCDGRVRVSVCVKRSQKPSKRIDDGMWLCQ